MNDLRLTALTADSTLGFLAAVGTFRLIADNFDDPQVRLGWPDGPYRPAVISTSVFSTVEQLSGALFELIERGVDSGQLIPGLDGLPIRPSETGSSDPMRSVTVTDLAPLLDRAHTDRHLALWLPALLGTTAPNDNDVVPLTMFLTAGPGTVWVERTLSKLVDAISNDAALQHGLVAWRRVDSMGAYLDSRADTDAARVQNSSGPQRKYGEPAASWLALMALPMFPVRATATGALPVGWARRDRLWVFRYPVWSRPLDRAAVSSAVEHPVLRQLNPKHRTKHTREIAERLGFSAVFESVRPLVGNNLGAMQPVSDLLTSTE